LQQSWIPSCSGTHATGPPKVCWPAEVYAALWLGALLHATGELPDPFPPQIDELARRYFEALLPEVKA
jgi:hypothetical protein